MKPTIWKPVKIAVISLIFIVFSALMLTIDLFTLIGYYIKYILHIKTVIINIHPFNMIQKVLELIVFGALLASSIGLLRKIKFMRDLFVFLVICIAGYFVVMGIDTILDLGILTTASSLGSFSHFDGYPFIRIVNTGVYWGIAAGMGIAVRIILSVKSLQTNDSQKKESIE